MAITVQNRTTNSTDFYNSRYVQGGVTDRYNTRLGWWEKQDIPTATDDMRIVVGTNEAGRPDLLAYRLYKKPELGWLVLQFNNIVDPTIELFAGKQLIMPSLSRVLLNILITPAGGKEVSV